MLVCSSSYAQLLQLYQAANVEKYRGKDFLLEGKILYDGAIAPDSYTVLFALSVDANSKPINSALFNDDASQYYKKGKWSPYELQGTIDKNARYLAVGIAIAGNNSYYADDFKLFVKDGGNKIEIPLENAGFENVELTAWQTYGANKNTLITLSPKSHSGNRSLFIDNSKVTATPALGSNPQVGRYIKVNGVKLYYEIYGEGEPLLLLHGNNSSMGSFGQQFDALSKKYKIVALDSRGQGNSSADNTKLTYELMAEDVNTFLDKLKLKDVDVLGWSDGGNIALILAMKHPDKVKRMAIMGTVLYNDETSVIAGVNDILRGQLKEMENKGVNQVTDMDYRLKMLLLTEPHINPDTLLKIEAPTLVMAGQYDVVTESHTKLIAEKIPHSKLVIFEGADHEAPTKIPELFNKTVLDFFE